MNLFQLRITLLDVEPAITRTVLVPSDISLGDLHQVIQHTMPWEFNHLHEFSTMDGDSFGAVGDFGDYVDDDDSGAEDERTVALGRVLEKEGAQLLYVYDLGDSWEHLITLEKIVTAPEKAKREAICLSGVRACPPEDCGGIPGYADLVEAMADPSHPERENLIDWLGEAFDPEIFDLAATNKSLRKLKLGKAT